MTGAEFRMGAVHGLALGTGSGFISGLCNLCDRHTPCFYLVDFIEVTLLKLWKYKECQSPAGNTNYDQVL